MAIQRNSKSDNGNSSDTSSAFDFAKLLGPYSLAGVDYSTLLTQEQKNIAALVEANRVAFQGWETLLRKQSDIFQETMAQTIAKVRKQDGAKSRRELVKLGFENALDNMREIAAMTAKYQYQIFGIVHQRLGENAKELHDAPQDH